MSVFKSMISAFAMYSAIPMPKVGWSEENHRYSLCFFPLIGAVIGWLYLLWFYICAALGIGGLLKGAVSAALPILVTGGIHADGFMDVTDARKCMGSREKKLEVMSDPHVGAFAVIYAIMYFLLQAAVFSEIKSVSSAVLMMLVFVMSRSLSGLCAVSFRCAKKEGTLQSFSKPAHKTVTVTVLAAAAAGSYALMLLSDIRAGSAALIAFSLCIIYYRISSYRDFGGITGDTEGWFLQICELSAPAAVLAAETAVNALNALQ